MLPLQSVFHSPCFVLVCVITEKISSRSHDLYFLFFSDMNSAARVMRPESAQCCGCVWEGKFSERELTVVQLSVNLV